MRFRDYATLIPFFVAVLWMVYRGFSAKKEYLRRLKSEQSEGSTPRTHTV